MSKNPQIPFIPVYMDGMGRALPRGQGLLVPVNGSVKIGKPLLKPTHMNVDETVKFVEEQVLKLRPKAEQINH